METLFTILFLLLLFLLRKAFSKYFLSPTGILAATWIVILFLKLLWAPDFYFSAEAAVLICLFIFSFFCGDFLFAYASRDIPIKPKFDYLASLKKDKRFQRRLLTAIGAIGIISIIGSILYLQYFINYFGSLLNVLGAGWLLRDALKEIQVPLFVRLVLLLNYSGVILTILYGFLYRFHFLNILPYLSVLLMGVTQAGRAGTIMILFQIFIAVFWAAIIKQQTNDEKPEFKKINPDVRVMKKSLYLVLIVGVIFAAGELYKAQSALDQLDDKQLDTFKDYLFGGIAGFTYNLQHPEFTELYWGRYSFSSLYNLLGIYKAELGIYTTFVPLSDRSFSMGNIFTSFRPLIDDFGVVGSVVFMFIFGIISSWVFMRSIVGSLAAISVCIVLYTYLFHTFLLPITVHNSILLSVVLPPIVIFLCKLNLSSEVRMPIEILNKKRTFLRE